jgi:carbonic anhydrase/acetyltransferase-like protein (isoleucine patch superfamily)
MLCMEWFSETPAGAFLAYNSTVTGDVRLGVESSVWFAAVVRGDVASVTIGDRVNIQDGAVVHCDTNFANTIEDDVTIGHRAVVHGERVGRGTLVGMGAVLLGHTDVGEECLIAAGTVVPPEMKVPDRMLVMGVPGRIVRPINEKEDQYLRWLSRRYVELVRKYQAGEFGKPDASQGRLPDVRGGVFATQLPIENDTTLATDRRLTSEELKRLDDLR